MSAQHTPPVGFRSTPAIEQAIVDARRTGAVVSVYRDGDTITHISVLGRMPFWTKATADDARAIIAKATGAAS